MSTVTKVNKLVTEILAQNPDGSAWKSDKTQKKLKNILNPKKTDPYAPKKPKSAYLFFFEHNSADVKEYLRSVNKEQQTEIVSEVARRWKALTSSSSKKDQDLYNKYVKLAEQDKERYQKEMENYSPPAETTTTKTKKTKRAKSAYMYFCEEKRPEVSAEGYRGKDIVVRIGNLWSEMTKDPSRADEYQKYLDMAADGASTNPSCETDKPSDVADGTPISQLSISQQELEDEPQTESQPEPEPHPELENKKEKKKSTRSKKSAEQPVKDEEPELVTPSETTTSAPVAVPSKKKTRSPK